MQYTVNYNLQKPTYQEEADIVILNENTDSIDSELKNIQDNVDSNFALTVKSVDGITPDNTGNVNIIHTPETVVIDNLESVNPNEALSASQGRILNERVLELESKVVMWNYI